MEDRRRTRTSDSTKQGYINSETERARAGPTWAVPSPPYIYCNFLLVFLSDVDWVNERVFDSCACPWLSFALFFGLVCLSSMLLNIMNFYVSLFIISKKPGLF